MATTTWHYVQNQFDNATKGNFKLMNTVNADHIAKLQAQQSDPDIAALLARTTPISNNYDKAYSHWFATKGTYKGETDRVEGLISEIGTKIKQWDIQIQVEYLRGTPDYTIILPNGKNPFYGGTMDDKISHVLALAERLTNYPALAALKNEVNAFYTTIKTARDLQQQKEELLDDASDLVETARIDIALMMYKNLGILMNKYASTPHFITNFWELSLISSSGEAEGTPTPPTPPVVAAIVAAVNMGVLKQIGIDFIGTNGKTVTIEWGDGTTTVVNLQSGSYSNHAHNYATVGNYTIRIIGDLADLIELRLIDDNVTALNIPDVVNLRALTINNNLLTSLAILAAMTNLLFLFVQNNGLDQQSVNSILTIIEAFGTSNGQINLSGGTNAAPTGQGIAAKNALIARGWTVTTN